MEHLFFKDWTSVFHVIICAVISFIALFIFIRISGKRTLAKLNAFDFVVTVTLGSTLSSMILKKVPLVEGSAGLIVIILLQYTLALLAKRSHKLEKIINSTPTLVFYDGNFIDEAMDKEVITKEEIYAEIRKYRLHKMDDVQAVVMELNGTFTVVKKSNKAGKSSLDDIELEDQ
ncbi:MULTISPECIES: DUF421 domain-containing protein [Pedobacter]|uniref:DUF421 domain-containing protein n=1 Tax=Pedobacter TaxID=84567 RepID=UPI001E56C10C|nr:MULTISPECIES: YetF domain-containing protein [Pedobacter]